MDKAPPGYADPAEVEWKHMEQMMPNAKFIKGGASAGDVKQGQIGDCWLIGALSVLATRDELLRGGQADSSEKDLKSGKVGEEMAWHLS